MTTLFEDLDQQTAEAYHLVLSATGIGCRVIRTEATFCIDVPDAQVAQARDTVEQYLAENAGRMQEAPKTVGSVADAIDVSGVGVALMLLAVHAAVATSAAPRDYVAAFGAQAGLITEGQWYRCATALLLHADAAHLAGNMAGMALFGGAVSAMIGSGVAWLLILVCGMIGNAVNAMVASAGHLSVGASTAVFSAVGFLCAIRAVDAVRTGRGWKSVGIFLGVGAGLLAFLGSGAQSDLSAHLFGLLAGGFAGLVYGGASVRRLGPRGQAASGFLAAALLLLAWFRGMTG
ncbi:Rhomboid family protein [Desulfosarcina cetonica]|nr:Rhomboid family protein [Desulfosarcina cetonica]